ncbi:ATP-binding protein [Actinoallomurus rhizosphaericola]|uniref:ATP-binding protein n=1 Tax=Actinoallomurus rhizosphaericola TaxID=2952536 RepID=UPI0020921530|nr:ATP-binding protein [Actinoallomurus rhizosphaericola]MCO5994893.1 ATP-binding protein [Actinoallomurus rhizosphaericola]
MSPECTADPSREQQWSCRLDGDPYAVVTARSLATAVLLGWNADLVEDVVLVTSELVTNAIAHAAAPVTFALTARKGVKAAIVIDVTDASPDLPVQDLPGEVGHFGLWIAEELARVTVHPAPPGKTVRATFDVRDASLLPPAP